jgi:hypothetical protein
MAQALSLPVIDVVQMSSASHAAADGNVYPAQLEISGVDIRIEVPRAVGAELRNQNIIALIGRDVLGHATLFYNGIAGQITLSIL